MKPFQSPFLHAIALMMALAQPSHAEVEWKPLSLAQRGRFIELQRGEFVRASSIRWVSGEIRLYARGKGPNSGFTSRSFPLSLSGIKELRDTDRVAMVREHRGPEANVEDFDFDLNVGIRVDNLPLDLLLITGEDPFGSWEVCEKKLKEAIASLDKLLEIASEAVPAEDEKPSK